MEKAIAKIEAQVPFIFDWVEYKGETCFASPNFEKTEKCGRVIIDIFYCATRALNYNVLKSVNWNPAHFQKSELSHEKWQGYSKKFAQVTQKQ